MRRQWQDGPALAGYQYLNKERKTTGSGSPQGVAATQIGPVNVGIFCGGFSKNQILPGVDYLEQILNL